jgi:hypothetical protein
MSEEYRKLTREHLNALAGEELPERALLSLVNADVAAPSKLVAALDHEAATETTQSRR